MAVIKESVRSKAAGRLRFSGNLAGGIDGIALAAISDESAEIGQLAIGITEGVGRVVERDIEKSGEPSRVIQPEHLVPLEIDFREVRYRSGDLASRVCAGRLRQREARDHGEECGSSGETFFHNFLYSFSLFCENCSTVKLP